jgi:hypothetical protein
MATTVAPKGRMTRPLHTPYSIGDTIRLLVENTGSEGRHPRKGDVGRIRRMYPACPSDGDETFLTFDVAWVDFGDVWSVAPVDEGFEPVARSVYDARRAAKKLARKARVLADSGADLTSLGATLERIAKKTEENVTWLRRMLNTLDTKGGA